MEKETLDCGTICTYLTNFLVGDFFLGLIVAILSGWGAVLIAERWASKRERAARERDLQEAAKSRLMDHVTELVKWYQINVRILRQNPADRSMSELGLAHASFVAHTKLLAIEPALEQDTQSLLEIARLMSNLWPADLKKASREKCLQTIYDDFAKVLDEIVHHIRALDVGN